MGSVQVRDVPDDVRRALHARAAAAGVSLSEFLLRELTRLAAYPPVVDVLRGASMRSGGVSQTDIVEAIRADRDGR